eukprot:gene10504-11605_t
MADDEQNHTPAQQSGPGGPARGHDNSPENSTELEFQNKMLAMVKDLVQKELHRSTNLPGPSHDLYFSNTDPDGVEPLEKEKNKGHRSKKKHLHNLLKRNRRKIWMKIMNPYPSWLVMLSQTTVKTYVGKVTKGPPTGRRTTLLPYWANDVQ